MIHSAAVNRPKQPRRIKSRKKAAQAAANKRASQPTLPAGQGPPPEVTRDLFLVWRAPRLGARNPQRLGNPVWRWLARSRDVNAWMANQHFGGPSSMEVGPGWCATRYGQTETRLPDGRVIHIGGEHEDHYDPDFFIYNDVFVTAPDGALEIYGYPHEVFPPTDFHSATVEGDRIVIIGCLGHPSQRVPGETPVFALDTRSLAITRLPTTGAAPGWIFKHRAELSADGTTITVTGGERVVRVDGQGTIRENHDDWSLDLGSMVWTRLTERRWQQWQLTRADGSSNTLFDLWCMSMHADRTTAFDREQMDRHERELGWLPDLALYAARHAPPFTHTPLPEQDGDPAMGGRIAVDGVTVRYVESSFDVGVVIEGELPPAQVELLIEDARSKLEALDRSPYVARLIADA